MDKDKELEIIKNLVTELSEKCDENRNSFSIAIQMKEDIILTAVGGRAKEITKGVLKIEQQVEKEVGLPFETVKDVVLGNCDCDVCKVKDEEIENDKANKNELSMFLKALYEIASNNKE